MCRSGTQNSPYTGQGCAQTLLLHGRLHEPAQVALPEARAGVKQQTSIIVHTHWFVVIEMLKPTIELFYTLLPEEADKHKQFHFAPFITTR